MGHMTGPCPYQGQFVGLTYTFNMYIKFGVLRSPITKMHNATQNVETQVV